MNIPSREGWKTSNGRLWGEGGAWGCVLLVRAREEVRGRGKVASRVPCSSTSSDESEAVFRGFEVGFNLVGWRVCTRWRRTLAARLLVEGTEDGLEILRGWRGRRGRRAQTRSDALASQDTCISWQHLVSDAGTETPCATDCKPRTRVLGLHTEWHGTGKAGNKRSTGTSKEQGAARTSRNCCKREIAAK